MPDNATYMESFKMTIKLIHIGAPKTASTFLQRQYFPKINARYLTSDAQTTNLKHQTVFRKINGSRLAPDVSLEKHHYEISRVHSRLRKVGAVSKLRDYDIISSEGLIGCSYNFMINYKENLKLLAEELGDYKILIVERDVESWMKSIYLQLILREDRYGRFMCVSEFFQTQRSLPVDWREIEGYCKNLFEDICVLSYENLQKDPASFLDALNYFIGADVSFASYAKVHKTEYNDLFYRGNTIKQKVNLLKNNQVKKIFENIYRNKKVHLEMTDVELQVNNIINA